MSDVSPDAVAHDARSMATEHSSANHESVRCDRSVLTAMEYSALPAIRQYISFGDLYDSKYLPVKARVRRTTNLVTHHTRGRVK